MKKIFFYIIILSLLTNCKVRQNKLIHYLSTLENIQILPPTKEEEIIIEKLKLESKNSLEKCKREGGNCIDDDPFSPANFKAGAGGFRKIIFEEFKVNADTKEGENKMLLTIGKKDRIESLVFLKYTDEDSKKQIERIFKSKALNQWSSAKNYGIPLKTQFQISIFIGNR